MTVPVVVTMTLPALRCDARISGPDSLRCTLPDRHRFGHVYHSAGGDIGDERPGEDS